MGVVPPTICLTIRERRWLRIVNCLGLGLAKRPNIRLRRVRDCVVERCNDLIIDDLPISCTRWDLRDDREIACNLRRHQHDVRH